MPPAAFTAFAPVPQGGALVSDSDTGSGADTATVAVAVADSGSGETPAAYTLWAPGTSGGGLDTSPGGSGNLSIGNQFSVSSPKVLTGIWWWSPGDNGGTAILPSACAIYDIGAAAQVSGTLNASPSWSGAAGTGWVKCTYSNNVVLSPGTNYMVVVYGNSGSGSTGWFGATDKYWTTGAGSGGLASGPLSAPNSAGSVSGQSAYDYTGAIALPASSVDGYNFWADVEVSEIDGSVAVAVSDADTASGADTGSVAVAVSGADTGTGDDEASVVTPAAPPPPLIPPGFASPAAFTAFMPPPQGGALVHYLEAGTGADTGAVAVAVSDADTASGADTGSVAVAVSGADTASGAGTGSAAVAVSDADTGTGADTGSVAVAVSGGDTASGADAGSVVTPGPGAVPLIPPGFRSPIAWAAFQQPPCASVRGLLGRRHGDRR